ncbi:hypothetical protein BASA50_000164 [Batrachochytrium salamandrivorans]|uniref:Pentacotripeptide-repeat region of PRORP domain-containing protein n=1 Tax=Batrachochytrium salamandrivorans TaxID=1357716 RepID=A0ABQ8EVG6_9FUNG|nr:hypothetical protein BASA50_000164 [Batrachochytrium salamandrivorans]
MDPQAGKSGLTSALASTTNRSVFSFIIFLSCVMLAVRQTAVLGAATRRIYSLWYASSNGEWFSALPWMHYKSNYKNYYKNYKNYCYYYKNYYFSSQASLIQHKTPLLSPMMDTEAANPTHGTDSLDSSLDNSLDSHVAWSEPFPVSIMNLITLLDQHSYRAAYSMFFLIMRTNQQELSELPSRCFTSLLFIIFHNLGRALGNTSKPRRLALAESTLSLMKKVGVHRDYKALALSIDVYGYLGNLDQVNVALYRLKSQHYSTNSFRVASSLCRAFILCDQEPRGMEYFEDLKDICPSVRTYNFLISIYAMTDNESGMFKALAKMQLACIAVDSYTMQLICTFYAKRKKYSVIKRHVDMFRSNHGVFDAGLYRILMSVANSTGDHLAVITLLDELNRNGVEKTYGVCAEIVIAYAELRDIKAMWDAYFTGLKLHPADITALVAMAKALGPLPGTDILSDLRIVSVHENVPFRQIVLHLLKGYTYLGQPESALELVKYQIQCDKNFSQRQHAHIVWSYFNAGDAVGGLAYANQLHKRDGANVDLLVWFAALVCAAKYLPDAVPQVISHIKTTYPNESTESLYQRAKAYIDNPSKSDGL